MTVTDPPLDKKNPPKLSVEEVAEHLNLSETLVRRLADSGVIQCVRVPNSVGGRIVRRFRPSWVEEFIAAHTTPAPGCPVGADPAGETA